MVAVPSDAIWDDLALRGAGGDAAARKKLVEQLWPVWIQRVRTRKSMRLLGDSEDHVHNVVARLVRKALDPSVLQSFATWRQTAGSATFRAWIFRVTDNEVHDYVRAVAGRSSASGNGPDGSPSHGHDSAHELSAKLLLNEFSSSAFIEQFGSRPPNTELQTAAELVRFAETRLPEPQTRALSLWLQGVSDDEIDAELGIERGAGKALRRAAIARLRREFGDENEPSAQQDEEK